MSTCKTSRRRLFSLVLRSVTPYACVACNLSVIAAARMALANETQSRNAARSAVTIAIQLCDEETDRDIKSRLFQEILNVQGPDRGEALRYVIEHCDADYAYNASVIWLQAAKESTADEVLVRVVVEWPEAYQRGILTNDFLRRDSELALRLARVLVDHSRERQPSDNASAGIQPSVPELAALRLATSTNEGDRATARRTLQRYPHSWRLWLVLLDHHEIAAPELAMAREVFATQDVDSLSHVAVAIVLANYDDAASGSCADAIAAVIADFDGRTREEVLSGLRGKPSWPKAIQEYRQRLELLAMLRFAPEDLVERLVSQHLSSPNSDIRGILGLVAARRCPDCLLGAHEQLFSEPEAKYLASRIREWYPMTSDSTLNRWLKELHQAAELRPEQQLSRYVFGPDVAQAAWWIDAEGPHAGRPND